MELITGENDKNRRLDRILRKALPDYPLPLIHKLLRQKKVLVNGKPGKANERVDSRMKITVPDSIKLNITQNHIKPSLRNSNKKKDIEIIWESEDLIAVNKPSGIAVHGKDSLDDSLNSYYKDKLPPSLSFKPGPLHRLDKPSSGIVVFSKSLEGARLFTSLIKERKVKKTYLAVVEGIIKNEETWQDELVRDKEKKKTFITKDICGKTAITMITPIVSENGLTLIKAQIVTGRTHQIRAQAASHGHPLAGDLKYGGKKSSGKNEGKTDFFLHAWKLEFLNEAIEAPVKKAILNMNPDRFPDGIYKRLSVGFSS